MVGYDKLISDFKRLAESNALSHAYLFFGKSRKELDVKFVFAQSLANYLENGDFKAPDNILKELLIIEPDKKSTIGIEVVRSLKYFLWQRPISSNRRIAIIKNAENLTSEAQNAALKIVEEPPASSLIIFIADNEDSLFPTLSSRVQKIYFSLSEEDQQFKETIKINKLKTEKNIEENQIDEFFESLIAELRKDPIKNSEKLKETLRRLTFVKQFNTNKSLQLKSLLWEKD